MVPNSQNMYYPYVYNPFNCACVPTSQIVIPQGQLTMPVQTVPPTVTPQQTNLPNVNYNQVVPYINTGSAVFNPSISTKSGQQIATANAPIVVKPITEQAAQVVYQGPVKNVNPQVSPIEQSDNEINKDMKSYFDLKASENPELKKALNNTIGKEEKPSILSTLAKVFGVAIIIAGAYKFRHKIPILNRFLR